MRRWKVSEEDVTRRTDILEMKLWFEKPHMSVFISYGTRNQNEIITDFKEWLEALEEC